MFITPRHPLKIDDIFFPGILASSRSSWDRSRSIPAYPRGVFDENIDRSEKIRIFRQQIKTFLKKSLRKLRFLPRGERDTSQPLKNIKITFKKRKRTKKTIFQNLQTGNVSKTSIFQKSQNFKIQKRNE